MRARNQIAGVNAKFQVVEVRRKGNGGHFGEKNIMPPAYQGIWQYGGSPIGATRCHHPLSVGLFSVRSKQRARFFGEPSHAEAVRRRILLDFLSCKRKKETWEIWPSACTQFNIVEYLPPPSVIIDIIFTCSLTQMSF